MFRQSQLVFYNWCDLWGSFFIFQCGLFDMIYMGSLWHANVQQSWGPGKCDWGMFGEHAWNVVKTCQFWIYAHNIWCTHEIARTYCEDMNIVWLSILMSWYQYVFNLNHFDESLLLIYSGRRVFFGSISTVRCGSMIWINHGAEESLQFREDLTFNGAFER